MKFKTALPLLALLAFPMALSAQDQQPGIAPPAGLDTSHSAEMLKYDMKVGKTFDIDMTVDQKMQMMGQNVDTTIMMGMKMAVENGGAEAAKKVTTSYTRTGMNMNMMGQSMKYDSAAPDAAASPLAAMGMMIGKEFIMLMDENSQVTAVKGLDELKASLGNGNPMLAGQMDTFLDEEQLKQMSNAWISEVLPSTPVKPGDSWDFSYSMSSAGVGKITYKGKAKLLGYSKIDGAEVGVIDLDGVIDTDLSEGDTSGPMAALGMKISGGKSHSIIYWDNALGYLRKMDAEQEMGMSMKNPQTGEEITMPIKQKVGMEVDVK